MRKRVARTALIALAVASVALMGVLLYPFASALLFAAVLAGVFVPVVDRLSKRLGGRRSLAAGFTTAAVAVLFVLPTCILAVIFAREAIDAVGYVSDTLRTRGISGLVQKLPPPLAAFLQTFDLKDPRSVQELAQAQGGRAAAAVGGVLIATSSVLVHLAVMLVALYFLLVDGPRLVNWLINAAPIGRSRTRELLHDFRNVSEALLVSSVATAGVQAVVALTGFFLLDVPQPVFFAFVTFIVAFIPVLGGASVSVGLAVLLYLTGNTQQALLLAAWGVVPVGLSDNIVKPLVMRGRMEVHGAVIFFALIGGLAAFGTAGLVAGPLIVSLFLAVVRMCRRDLQELEREEAETTTPIVVAAPRKRTA